MFVCLLCTDQRRWQGVRVLVPDGAREAVAVVLDTDLTAPLLLHPLQHDPSRACHLHLPVKGCGVVQKVPFLRVPMHHHSLRGAKLDVANVVDQHLSIVVSVNSVEAELDLAPSGRGGVGPERLDEGVSAGPRQVPPVSVKGGPGAVAKDFHSATARLAASLDFFARVGRVEPDGVQRVPPVIVDLDPDVA